MNISGFNWLVKVSNFQGETLSSLYKMLLSAVPVTNWAKGFWERDVGITLTDVQWNKIQEFNLFRQMLPLEKIDFS